MTSIPLLKHCKKCERDLPATTEYFHNQKKNKDGLYPHCKDCSRRIAREYQRSHAEEHREYQREYTKNNSEKVKDSQKRSIQKHGRKRAAIERERRRLNPDIYRERDRQKYAANPKRAMARTIRYRKSHPDIERLHSAAKNARKRASGELHSADIALAYRSQKGRCWHCGAELNGKYHLDHLIPIVRGGTNDPGNIVLACATCNLSKGAKLTIEWNGRLF